ncbi:MAG: BMP family ABC transporter substrate-binding protein [Deltaproteobacteria bacterium]|nr:BMP family ABC transporter substrate-binding protein [Deltaproteobacteria bacterium]
MAQIRPRHTFPAPAAAAALWAALALAACGGGGEKAAWSPGKPFPKENLKIAILQFDALEGNRSGYTFAHDRGIDEMQLAMGLGESQIVKAYSVTDGDYRTVENAMRELLAAGANVIIATSYNHMDVCEELAREYPGVVFANSSGYKFNRTNFTNYFGKIYQARYLAGLVAGMRTKTDKIGYVAARGRENSEVTGGLNAFAIGVEEANPRARVLVAVIHRWLDPEGEARAARKLVGEGADVIAQHTNTPAPQREAEKLGIWGIGYHSDMSADAPGSVVASVVWNWGVYYKLLAGSIVDGTFTTKPYVGDLEDGMVDITPLKPSLAPEGAVARVERARRRIEGGQGDVFEGALATNDGRTVGEPGGRLNYSQVSMDSHWYYRNVVEVD